MAGFSDSLLLSEAKACKIFARLEFEKQLVSTWSKGLCGPQRRAREGELPDLQDLRRRDERKAARNERVSQLSWASQWGDKAEGRRKIHFNKPMQNHGNQIIK